MLVLPLPPSLCHGLRFDQPVQSPLPFHPAFGIVDAAVDRLGVEAERIRHAQHDPFAVDERQQRARVVAGGDLHVVPEPQRVELVRPVVIVGIRGGGIRVALEVRARHRVERPAFRTQLALRGVRAVERSLALAPIEAGKMAAPEHRPRDPVSIDVHAAR